MCGRHFTGEANLGRLGTQGITLFLFLHLPFLLLRKPFSIAQGGALLILPGICPTSNCLESWRQKIGTTGHGATLAPPVPQNGRQGALQGCFSAFGPPPDSRFEAAIDRPWKTCSETTPM